MIELWTGYGIVLLIMFIGVMGNLIPGIPGTPLILAGAVGHQLYFAGQGGVGWWWVAGLTIFGLLALGLDYLATLLGAKKLGATWKGMVGAVLGLALGVVGKLVCSVAMFALFSFKAWPSASALPVVPTPPPIVEAPASETPEAAQD